MKTVSKIARNKSFASISNGKRISKFGRKKSNQKRIVYDFQVLSRKEIDDNRSSAYQFLNI